MTKIILHGGYPGWVGAGEDRVLFQKLIDAAEQSDGRVLFSFLAYDTPSDWPHLEQLQETFHDMNPQIELTIAGRDNFAAQLPHHKALFLQGGKPQPHLQALADISKEDLLRDKVLLGGSSSGAMMLCKWANSRSSNGPFEGKGIVDLAIMPHADAWHNEDLVLKMQKLKEQTGSSVLLLNELQMVELTIG